MFGKLNVGRAPISKLLKQAGRKHGAFHALQSYLRRAISVYSQMSRVFVRSTTEIQISPYHLPPPPPQNTQIVWTSQIIANKRTGRYASCPLDLCNRPVASIFGPLSLNSACGLDFDLRPQVWVYRVSPRSKFLSSITPRPVAATDRRNDRVV